VIDAVERCWQIQKTKQRDSMLSISGHQNTRKLRRHELGEFMNLDLTRTVFADTSECRCPSLMHWFTELPRKLIPQLTVRRRPKPWLMNIHNHVTQHNDGSDYDAQYCAALRVTSDVFTALIALVSIFLHLLLSYARSVNALLFLHIFD